MKFLEHETGKVRDQENEQYDLTNRNLDCLKQPLTIGRGKNACGGTK
jgi:hypothetical protein